MAADYYRDAHVNGGTAEVFVYVEDDWSGVSKHQLEQIEYSISGDTTRSASFELHDSTSVNVGVELWTESAAAGGSSRADLFNQKGVNPWGPRYHAEVDEIRIREI